MEYLVKTTVFSRAVAAGCFVGRGATIQHPLIQCYSFGNAGG
jgi:hypothetical protein